MLVQYIFHWKDIYLDRFFDSKVEYGRRKKCIDFGTCICELKKAHTSNHFIYTYECYFTELTLTLNSDFFCGGKVVVDCRRVVGKLHKLYLRSHLNNVCTRTMYIYILKAPLTKVINSGVGGTRYPTSVIIIKLQCLQSYWPYW